MYWLGKIYTHGIEIFSAYVLGVFEIICLYFHIRYISISVCLIEKIQFSNTKIIQRYGLILIYIVQKMSQYATL